MKKIILSLLVLFMSLPALAGSRLDVCKSTVRLSEAYTEWPDKYKKMIDDTFVNPLPDAYKAQYATGVGCTAKCEAGQKLIDCVTPQEHVTECAKIFASDYIEHKYRSQFEQELCGHIPESAEAETDDIFKGKSISYWIADKEKKQGNSTTSSGTENKPAETKPAATPAASAKTITISGTVRDAIETLIQASISYTSANGTPTGTVTDMNGKFTLNDVPSNATVTISYAGCTEQKYTASSIPSTIKLDCDNYIDETVVVAENLAGKPCRDEYIKGLNAESGKYVKNDNDRQFCDITCRKNYTKTPGSYSVKIGEDTSTQPYKCICSGDFVEIGTECLPVSGCSKDPGVKESKYEKSGNTYECVVKSCDCGYTLNNGKCEKWDTSTCTTMPENASKIERTCKNGAEYCEVKQCECGHTLKDNQCQKMAADTCTKKPKHATKISHVCNDGVETCIVTECEDGWKPDPETNATACIKKLKECTPEQKEQLTKEHATKTGIKTGTETCIALACECGYDLVGEKCVAWAENTPCATDKLPKDAKSGIRACNERGKEYCKITACTNDTEYTHNTEKNRCEYLKGETCTHTDTNAERAEWKNVDGKLVCTLKKCKDGFYVVDNKCEPSDGDCTAEQLKQIEHAVKGARKKDKCTPTECEPGFEPSGNKCVEIAGKCETKPEHSKKSHREFVSGAEICKIDECDDGYRISSDGQKCEPSLDEKQARDKAKELRANADEMKRVEQSTENKLLGAAGMGAAGIGGMQVASALAEKNADEDAERDMAAYLATFRCDYGHGLNIKGGETGIELPGANSLIPLYQEYVNLANDLKVRKNALGMKPGIESEKILDAATSGLYDNQSIGKVDGAFTSLARALADPTGADAAEWAAQKDATAKKLKTGAVVAGVGILGSAVGNAIINRNVNERSDEIKRKYENIEDIPKPTPLPTERKCSDFNGATGTYPECTCTDNTNYFAAEQGCVPCGTGQTFNTTTKKCECTDTNKQYNESENKCTCKSPMVENASGVCTNPQPPVPGCELTGLITKDCECVNGAAKVGNNCECRSGWYSPDNKTCAECQSSEHKVVVDNQCVCQAPYYSTDGNETCTECKASDNKEIKDGKCQCKEGYNPDSTTGKCERIPAPEPLIKISFGSDVLFETGSAKLANNGKTMLDEFNKRLEDAQKNSNNKFDLKTDTDYCISVTGHTDRTPFRGDQLKNAPTNPNNKNMKLSLQRANAVKDKLSEVANPANIWAQGLGENHCTVETYPARNDQRCRRVDIEFWTGSCESNKTSATSGMLQSTVKGLADNVGNQLIKNITGDTKKN